MTMQSSAGLRKPHYGPSLWLSVLVIAVLAGSFLLAFLPALPRAHPKAGDLSRTVAMTPVASPAPRFPSASSEGPPTLWTVLTPFAIGIDAIAVLGLVAVLLVRRR